jgi:hypothetical protein
MEDTGVVNTPTTRPPGRPRSERRSPKGPSVARSRPTPELIRSRLTVAADRLRTSGDNDLAEAIEHVTAPGGWKLLQPRPATSEDPNVALFMNKAIKDVLMAKAEAAGTTLTADVNEAFEKFLAGEFTPTAPIRSRRGSGAEKTNLNVRPRAALKEQVDQLAEAKSAELGWKVTAGRVATAYLYAKYEISAEEQAK